MATYSGPSSVNSYWYYDPHGYQPNVSVSYDPNMSVNTPSHSSFDMYNNHSITATNNNVNNSNSRFVDSGYLSRTPTPPTPMRPSSPLRAAKSVELETEEAEEKFSEKSGVESKPRLPYVKRTRIQYTLQQLQILEQAFEHNHYPEVTTVDGLAELLGVRHEKISIWFQNRRSRFKRQQKPKATSSATSSTSLPSETNKKLMHSVPVTPVVPSPSYDPSVSYYAPYFWPSPIVDNRTSASYSANTHASSFYDPTTSPMWNTNTNPSYLSSTQWHQSSCPPMNLSLSSPSSPCTSLLPEHHPSM